MMISVSGSYSTWDAKKQYSISVWDCDETMCNALTNTLEKMLNDAVKCGDYEKVSDIAISIKNFKEGLEQAKIEAKQQEEEYLEEQAKQAL